MDGRGRPPRQFIRREIVHVDGVADDCIGAIERVGLALRNHVLAHQTRQIGERLAPGVTSGANLLFDRVAFDRSGERRLHATRWVCGGAADSTLVPYTAAPVSPGSVASTGD